MRSIASRTSCSDRDHASQRHSFRQHAIANARAQSLLRGNVDLAAQERLELAESIAEADRGEVMSAAELLRRLSG